MKFMKMQIWSAVNGKAHESLTEEEQKISAFIPIVNALFPGIDYYSITGFGQVMTSCVTPVLKKRFPELQSAPAESITREEMVEVMNFLPSKGYEWQDSKKWRSRFEKLLAKV